MKPRTRARALALQVLYEVDIANHVPGEVFTARLEETPLTEELAEFARQIIFGCREVVGVKTAVTVDEFVEFAHVSLFVMH